MNECCKEKINGLITFIDLRIEEIRTQAIKENETLKILLEGLSIRELQNFKHFLEGLPDVKGANSSPVGMNEKRIGCSNLEHREDKSLASSDKPKEGVKEKCSGYPYCLESNCGHSWNKGTEKCLNEKEKGERGRK